MTVRKPRRIRWQPTADTLGIALHFAAKPAKADTDQVLAAIQGAFRALREGVATELQWSILAGSLDVSKAIEAQGIVRGLNSHLVSAEAALQMIYNRACLADGWRATALHFNELEDVRTFVDLHAFQVRQLSRAEFLAAIDTAQGKVRANGGQATLARAHDTERMAA
jgi:hypothetical protein